MWCHLADFGLHALLDGNSAMWTSYLYEVIHSSQELQLHELRGGRDGCKVLCGVLFSSGA